MSPVCDHQNLLKTTLTTTRVYSVALTEALQIYVKHYAERLCFYT